MPAPVIVVHDDPETCAAALDALRAAGHWCAVFTDPLAALDAVDASDTRLRILVTRVDFGRGKLNGVALARMLKVKQPGVQAIFVARPEYMEEAAKVGEWLPLPLDPQALVQAVNRIAATN